MRPIPDPIAPGREGVWRFPRPAIAGPGDRRICIGHRGVPFADMRRAVRPPATGHLPNWYMPFGVPMPGPLHPEQRSFREWKGRAVYWHLAIGDRPLRDAAWRYPGPVPAFAAFRRHVAFCAGPLDQCGVDGGPVIAQPGGFHGGRIMSGLAGPFKGVRGSMAW